MISLNSIAQTVRHAPLQMTKRKDTIELPYSAQQMFDLVSDIERYPEFLPYCTGLRILKKSENAAGLEYLAQMLVQYKVFREQFKCRVEASKDADTIEVHFVEGPIKRLYNHWHFEDVGAKGSITHFTIDFEFSNFLLQTASNAAFEKAYNVLSNAFIARAHALYQKKII